MIAYLGLGSNIGERENYLNQAIASLSNKCKILKVSSFYNTTPWGYLEQPDFLNATIKVSTRLGPLELLAKCMLTETQLGRYRGIINGPRKIDIDILLYENLAINETDLIIPHPRLHERRFVLEPLSEIAPDAIHPILNKTVLQMYNEVKK